MWHPKLRKPRKLTDKDNEFVKLYGENRTMKEIAQKFGVSRCLIMTRLKENGVKLRKPNRRLGAIAWNKNKPYLAIRGKKHPRWKNGITTLNQQLRHCIEMKNWKRTIIQRDNFTCVDCGKTGSNIFEIDHYPKRFAQIISDNKLTSYQEAQLCDELWDLNNGRTLCIDCHNKTRKETNSVCR